jgi:hypothetical protein
VGAAAAQPRHITSPQDEIYVGCSTAKVRLFVVSWKQCPGSLPGTVWDCRSGRMQIRIQELKNISDSQIKKKKLTFSLGKWRLLLKLGNPIIDRRLFHTEKCMEFVLVLLPL